MSSLLGIGGGLLITPYLLSLGIATEAVVATSSFMIVWRMKLDWKTRC
jgi:uncharacterized membrane protein YfcA